MRGVLERPDGTAGRISIYHAYTWHYNQHPFASVYDKTPGYWVCEDGVYYVTGSRHVFLTDSVRGLVDSHTRYRRIYPVEYVFS